MKYDKKVLRALGLQIAMFAVGPTVYAAATADPYVSMQWYLHNDGSSPVMTETNVDDLHTIMQSCTPGVNCVDIGWTPAVQAQVNASGTNPVIVAVIDTGVDNSHPDLAGRLTFDSMDFLENLPVQTDTNGHGTPVAGIIAATTDNGVGIAGIAPPSVKIESLKIIDAHTTYKNFALPDPITQQPKLESDFAAQAINYAVAHGASIINMSLGWPQAINTTNVQQAVANAIAKNVLIVAAANNSQTDQPDFPCSYAGVLCVGSVTNTGSLSVFSNYGGRIDMTAPGEGILSTYPMKLDSQQFRVQGYDIVAGTSFSAPVVAGVAAAIRATYPQITLSELVARLLISTLATGNPSEKPGDALYGIVNLPAALNAKPQPVYYPDFKNMSDLIVDESTLQANGSITVHNLWADGKGVQVQALIGGNVVGSLTTATFAGGGSITVPWQYRFHSLDDSADLTLTLHVTDANGFSRDFSARVSAMRAIRSIAKPVSTIPSSSIPSGQGIAPVVFKAPNGQVVTNLQPVIQYGHTTGTQAYFQQIDQKGTLLIFDPTNAQKPITTMTVPGINGAISSVTRVDVHQRGELDWVVTGFGVDSSHKQYFAIYYMNPSFQPLTGDQTTSQWQLYAPIVGKDILRNYGRWGSWLNMNGSLVPCFVDTGYLPNLDVSSNIGDPLRSDRAQHLYFVSPHPAVAGKPTQADLRVVDNETFEQANPGLAILAMLPPSQAEENAGHIRLLLQNQNADMTAPVTLMDVPAANDYTLTTLPGWNPLLASGLMLQAQTANANEAHPFTYGQIDAATAFLAWSSNEGVFLGTSDYAHVAPSDPFADLLGAFDFGSSGRVWFMDTGFQLAAYTQDSAFKTTAKTNSITLERDSTLPESDFVANLTPVVLGTKSNPIGAELYDRSFMYGDRLYAALWDNQQSKITTPLRYSFQMDPGTCLKMDPAHLTKDPESFAIPLLCLDANGFELDTAQP